MAAARCSLGLGALRRGSPAGVASGSRLLSSLISHPTLARPAPLLARQRVHALPTRGFPTGTFAADDPPPLELHKQASSHASHAANRRP
eukprot:SAG22_NODE_10691_length_520_cov_1.422803_1_plen_88_part_01